MNHEREREREGEADGKKGGWREEWREQGEGNWELITGHFQMKLHEFSGLMLVIYQPLPDIQLTRERR